MAYKTWEEVSSKQGEAQKQLTSLIGKAAAAVGATWVKNVNKDTDVAGPTWGMGPIKEREKADEKVMKKYAGKGASRAAPPSSKTATARPKP